MFRKIDAIILAGLTSIASQAFATTNCAVFQTVTITPSSGTTLGTISVEGCSGATPPIKITLNNATGNSCNYTAITINSSGPTITASCPGPTDITKPTLSGITIPVESITINGMQFKATSNETGTGYWIVVYRGSATPTAAQIKTATGYPGATTLSASGNSGMFGDTEQSFSATGLYQGVDYTLYMVAADVAGNLSAVASKDFKTAIASPPSQPTGITVKRGDRQITVSFTPPASNGGTAIQTYLTTCSRTDNGGGGTGSGTGSPVTVTGLTNGQSHTCTVAAYNGYGWGTSDSSPPETPADTTPDPFLFGSKTGVALGKLFTSLPVSITGIDADTKIRNTNGFYSLDGTNFVTGENALKPGQQVWAQISSPNIYSDLNKTTICVGDDYSSQTCSDFSVTTHGPASADPFFFAPVRNAAIGTSYTADLYTQGDTANTLGVSGLSGSSTISVDNGDISLDGGSTWVKSDTVNNGNQVKVRQTSSDKPGKKTQAIVTIGETSATFEVSTKGRGLSGGILQLLLD